MKTPKLFKANLETSIYGFNSGLSQIATPKGLSHKEFNKIPENKFEAQSQIEMFLLNNHFIINIHIVNPNNTVERRSENFMTFKDANAAFKALRKKYKLKVVDQTNDDTALAA